MAKISKRAKALAQKADRTKVLPLGDDVGFICGHGPGGKIGDERRSNPFLRGI